MTTVLNAVYLLIWLSIEPRLRRHVFFQSWCGKKASNISHTLLLRIVAGKTIGNTRDQLLKRKKKSKRRKGQLGWIRKGNF